MKLLLREIENLSNSEKNKMLAHIALKKLRLNIEGKQDTCREIHNLSCK